MPIVTRLKQVLEEFCTALDCVDVGFISDGLPDTLLAASQLGSTRIGGIDLNKPRSRAALGAAPALAIAPGGFTVADFTRKVRDMTGQPDYTTRNAAYDLRKLRGKHLTDQSGCTWRYPHLTKRRPHHRRLVAGLAEQALAGPEHDREDHQPQLVGQVMLDQRTGEPGTGVEDDVTVQLLLQLRDLGGHVPP